VGLGNGSLLTLWYEVIKGGLPDAPRQATWQIEKERARPDWRTWRTRGPPMRLIILLPAALLSLFAASQGPSEAADRPKPNFIFILIDDLGWKDLGCYGGTFAETPQCDKLAAQGMRFTDAYAACPVCSPTRASILTGKYPAPLHLTDWLPGRAVRPTQKLLRPKFQQFLPLEEVTQARALKPLGYASASIGKWHLGGARSSPEKHGFDLNVGGSERGSPPRYFFPYRNQSYRLPGLERGQEGEYLTDRLTDEAEKFITAHRDKPFFLYLAHYAVHIPLQAKKNLVAKYEAKAKAGPDDARNNPVYAAMVESTDDSVGRVLKKLEALQIADRTVVMLFSDNGGLSVREGPHTPATSNAPLRAGKGYLYEGGIREPLLIRWPGVIRPGSVCDVPVCSIDFFPTLLELAGGKVDPGKHVDGVSLVPLLKQAGRPKRDALYWHYPHYSNQGGKPGGAVRRGDFKLIEVYEDGRLELYDLKADVGEKNDLAAQMPDRAKELYQALKAWRKAVHAQMPAPNPDYRPPQATPGE
jgi:arylsulfatase A-like enzyme